MFSFHRPAPQAYAFGESAFYKKHRLTDARVAELNDNNQLVALLIHDMRIPFISYGEVTEKLKLRCEYKFVPELDHFSCFDNQIISFREENNLKLAEVQYDQLRSMIYPPMKN
jgi:hypothetical protein